MGSLGHPGSGKSTFAALLGELLGADLAVVVPMDGFHLSDAVLAGGPFRDRKGAIETFDVGGYASLLQRLARPVEPVVYAPDFNRSLDEPIAASIAIPADLPLVITEGNYLLADGQGWQGIREHLDEVWYLESPETLRRQRLTERHMLFGKDLADAEKWAHGTDQSNAELVHATRHKANRIIPWS
nr:nucleoside/nucleotide kinase family protein [Pseudarthrobacter sp. NS4]